MKPAISIVLRSRNDGGCLRETLEALVSQRCRCMELIAVDNDSRDGSAELLRERADVFVHVPEGQYEPGPVLNDAVERAAGEIVVLLNSDATPQHPEWLAQLISPLKREGVAAVYGRQIARPEARPLVVADLLRAYPPESRDDTTHFFSFVSAAFWRHRWRERPFWDRGYAEDYEWTLLMRRAGYDLAYAHDSVVMHSHNYSSRQLWGKRFRHGWADAKIYGRSIGRWALGNVNGRRVYRRHVWRRP